MEKEEVEELKVGDILRFLTYKESERAIVLDIDKHIGKVKLLNGSLWIKNGESSGIKIEYVPSKKLLDKNCRLQKTDGRVKELFLENVMREVETIEWSVARSKNNNHDHDDKEILERILEISENKRKYTLERVIEILEKKRKPTLDEKFKYLENKCQEISEQWTRILRDELTKKEGK